MFGSSGKRGRRRIEPRFEAVRRRRRSARRSRRPSRRPPQAREEAPRAAGVAPSWARWSIGAFVLGVWGVVALGGLFAYYASQLPPIDQLAVPKRPPDIQILGVDGAVLADRGDTGGAAVRLGDLPPYLPKAFVAIEDRRFYYHFGVDPVGISRAVVSDVAGSGGMQGGSTLTQQLAKNLFLTQERTISRKFQEAILALWLERKYSKDQILELYLNRVYFGSGAYGVRGGGAQIFRQRRQGRDAVGGGAAGGLDEIADQARAQPQSEGRQRARRAGHHRDGGAGLYHPGDGQGRARRARRKSPTSRARAPSITPPIM